VTRRIRKVLIANRGEIAVRIARTCRAMGIQTAAVYSEADRGAFHTRACDEAYFIGPAEAARSYLDVEKLVDTAFRNGCDAVHPGYGFLSQRGDFAEACLAAGLAFIGPPGDVHRVMGDKKGARRLMSGAGVPVVPGYDGDDQQDGTLVAQARRIGWPVMIKPSRGGGGKGMRVVAKEADMESALAASRRESISAFGDDTMVIERFVEKPRHVEVQILADSEGHIIHLFERECSIQRRHQKIVEETPSPGLSPSIRERLWAAGVAAARAASYVNAGTVEFLLAPDGAFYFLEMNTRLQVEHPVTEAVTGLDLVRLQIDIAEGSELPFEQHEIASRGHGMECRLYAEDPAQGDLPSPGPILLAAFPEGPGVRCDRGIDTGSTVSVHYDPLLAKIVTWGADRGESIERMAAALRETVVLGVTTNLARLTQIVDDVDFREGEMHTGFVDQQLGDLPSAGWPPDDAIAAALAAVGSGSAAVVDRNGRGLRRVPDPWSALGGFRL
jgi:3-methylcrotonyl-CoA carboxylase alpha subunit